MSFRARGRKLSETSPHPRYNWINISDIDWIMYLQSFYYLKKCSEIFFFGIIIFKLNRSFVRTLKLTCFNFSFIVLVRKKNTISLFNDNPFIIMIVYFISWTNIFRQKFDPFGQKSKSKAQRVGHHWDTVSTSQFHRLTQRMGKMPTGAEW